MNKNNIMLIIDINDLDRACLEEFFKSQFKLFTTDNADEALRLVAEKKPDIILLGLHLPEMSNLSLLRELRSEPSFNKIPIIITTNKQDNDIRIRALKNGANDYISRPYDPITAHCRIANVLNRTPDIYQLQRKSASTAVTTGDENPNIDRITGLYTQRGFIQQAGHLINKNPDTAYTIIYLDIAGFKIINELFGLETGDSIIKTASAYLKTITTHQGIASHLSADSFAICLPEDLVDIELILQGIDATMLSLALYRNVVFYAGLYTTKNPYCSVAQMLDKAHLAMNSVKSRLINRYAIYDNKLHNNLTEEHILTQNLEESLKNGDFFIKLQPIYDAQENHPIAAEALLRWNHPRWGMISPQKFIPIFEKSGFINRIDRFTWECSCRFLSRQKDWNIPVVPVSVNISPVDIFDPGFVDYLLCLLRKYDLQPSMLWLEITEKAYLEAPSRLIKILQRLKNCGFPIILDDFGSGYSTLSILKNLSVDLLKIDISQFKNNDPYGRGDIILESVIALAKRLNIKIITERVENEQQVQALLRLGCTLMQGFHFSAPLTSDEYISTLADLDII